MNSSDLIIVRGAGDIASGTIHRLHQCGLKLLVLETENPTVIRRSVAFAQAVYDGSQEVEGVTAVLAGNATDCDQIWRTGGVPLLLDPDGKTIARFSPQAVVDAILAKKNLGTSRQMAPVTVALGPGFIAGRDVDAVIETARGHDLGRVIYEGPALANTGLPQAVAGIGKERVIYATTEGRLQQMTALGSRILAGQLLATIGQQEVRAPISGLLRGMIQDGFAVWPGLKIADIDPRPEGDTDWRTISDKARCISGGVLEALFHLHAARATIQQPVETRAQS